MEEPVQITCPWCGECIDTFFDWSAGSQTYVEDCQVCCRPIVLSFALDEEDRIQVFTERE